MAFRIPAQARQDALIAFAQQAGLSIGFAPGAQCAGQAGVSGRMTADAALGRLLEGSACEARRPDSRSVVIQARRRPAPAGPAPRPSPRPPAPIPAQVAELVITAEKRESLLSSSASGLTALSGADLARQGVADARDLSLLAAGVTVTNLGPGRNKILLRGLSDGPLTGHTQSTVGIYLGEMRLTYNAPDPDLPFIDVARVEVLRGPQGSLYGAGSVGGVLHVTPNAPDPEARSAYAEAGAGDTAHGAASTAATVVYNQPLFGHRAAARLVAWTEGSGGHIDDVGRNLRDVDRTRRRGVRLAGLWRPADDLALEAMLVNQTIDTRDAHYAQRSVGRLARSAAVAEPHDNDFTALSLSAHWTPSWGRLTATMSAIDHNVGTTYDAAAAPASLATPRDPPGVFEDDNDIRGVLSEIRIASTGRGRLQWMLGAFAASGRQRLDAAITSVSGAEGYHEARRDRLYEAALFGETSYDVTSRLTLTLGGRIFDASLKSASQLTLGAPLARFDGRADNGGFAPKARLAFRPASRMLVYAVAAEGYRTAGFNTGGPPGQAFGAAGAPAPLRRYGGDELRSYEAGVRWRSETGRAAVRAAAFEARWRDIQADLLLPSGLAFTANLGDGRSRGVELEATYQTRRLRIAGNVVSQDSELTRPAAGISAGGDPRLPGVPEISFALTGAYAAPIGEGRTLDLAASYAYVGRSRLAVDPATTSVMGGYGELRLAATLRLEHVSLGLSVDNVLNDHGDTLAFGNPFSIDAAAQATPQRPRTISLRARRSF